MQTTVKDNMIILKDSLRCDDNSDVSTCKTSSLSDVNSDLLFCNSGFPEYNVSSFNTAPMAYGEEVAMPSLMTSMVYEVEDLSLKNMSPMVYGEEAVVPGLPEMVSKKMSPKNPGESSKIGSSLDANLFDEDEPQGENRDDDSSSSAEAIQVCEAVSVKINGEDSDWLRSCDYHDKEGKMAVHCSEFRYRRCGNINFKSVLGRISLSGLGGGAPKKKQNYVEKIGEKGVSKATAEPKIIMKDTKQRTKRQQKKAIEKRQAFEVKKLAKEAKQFENVEAMDVSSLLNWYQKNWMLPTPYRFSMVRGDPVLEVLDSGRWYKVGMANKVYNRLNTLNDLLSMAGESKNESYHPKMPETRYKDETNIGSKNWLYSKFKAEANQDMISKLMGSELERPTEVVSVDTDDNINQDLFSALFDGSPIDIVNEMQSDESVPKHIKFKLTQYDDRWTLGEDNNNVALTEDLFGLWSRFGKRFDVPELSRKFVEETGEIPFKSYNLRGLTSFGNFTGKNHPPEWDGRWDGSLVPLNEGDFISSFHDMMTNSQRSLENMFIEWWNEAGYPVIGSVMSALLPLTEQDGEGSWTLKDNVVERIGSEGYFTNNNDNYLDIQTTGLPGAGRGDSFDIGRQEPVIAVSPWEEATTNEPWSIDSFESHYDSSIPSDFQGRETPSWSTLFYNDTSWTQLQSSLRFPSTSNVTTTVGPRFQPSYVVFSMENNQQKTKDVQGVKLIPSNVGSDYPISFKPSYESLAALNPNSTFSSVSSANRSYTTTPYGDMSYLVYLFKNTNLYINKVVVNHFLGCFRMIRFAAMCEAGSYDINRGGFINQNTQWFFSQGMLAPSVFGNLSTIRFVKINNYVNNNNTAPMQAINSIIKGPGGRTAFLGTSGQTSNGVTNETFILQLLMLGADCPDLGRYGFMFDIDGDQGEPVTWIDVATGFRSGEPVNIVVFMSGEAPLFKAGQQPYGSIGYEESMIDITVADVVYDLEDLIGSFARGSWEYWSTQAYNLALQIGCTDFWNQAMFFFLHNCSVSDTPQIITSYNRYDNGVISPFNVTAPIFPHTDEREIGTVGVAHHQYCCGLEAEVETSDGSDWAILLSLGIRVPAESGMEYLVIFGFAEPAKRSGSVYPFDAVKTWRLRFWCPEFLSQAYAETNREFFYTANLYNRALLQTTGIPTSVINLYNQVSSNNTMIIPKGQLTVNNYYNKITSTKTDFFLIQPTLGWILKHDVVAAYSSLVIPFQRPEFLVSVTKYTSSRLTVWGPSPGDVLTTPKLSKKYDKTLSNVKYGANTYELSIRMSTNENSKLTIDPDIITTTYAAINLTEHYNVVNNRMLRLSKKTTLVSEIGKYMYVALRLSDIRSYKGAQTALYRLIYYDLESISPVAVTNVSISASIIVSRTLFSSMIVLGDEVNSQPDMADPDGFDAREYNFNLIEASMAQDVAISVERGVNSSQEQIAVAAKDGVVSSPRGVSVASVT